MISKAVTHGILSYEQLRHAFSAERRSTDILSTDFDSSIEGSVGGDSSLWKVVTESGDKSTQFSSSLSDDNEEHVADAGDESIQVVNAESTDSGTEGDNEEPKPRYELKSRSRKQCKPPAKRSRYGDTSDEDDASLLGGGSLLSKRSRGHDRAGRSRGHGNRGHGGRGRGGG